MVRVTGSLLDELGTHAGDAWALWEELRRARPAGQEASPEEVRALGEYVRADARVVGATRLADALAIPISDAFARPDLPVLPLGIAPDVARERALAAARRRRRQSGGW